MSSANLTPQTKSNLEIKVWNPDLGKKGYINSVTFIRSNDIIIILDNKYLINDHQL